jgi:hypothetical protein
MNGEKFFPGQTDAVLRFAMPRRIFEQFRTSPVALHLTLAIDQAHAVRTASIPMPGSRFEVPGFGLCTPETGWDGEPVTVGIGCLAPMRQPALTYITALWRDNCRTQQLGSQPTITGYGWTGSLDAAPAEFGLTGVWSVPVDMTNSWRYANQERESRIHMRQLCPGTPVTFTSYALETRTRLEFSIPDFRLPEIADAKLVIQTH